MSESVENIASALAALQEEIENPSKSATVDTGKFSYDYCPLPDLIDSLRPLLAKHNLAVVQMPAGDGKEVTVTTMIVHSSGEYIQSPPLTLQSEKPGPQGAGSAITYGRRYSLAAMLGIASEEDDDASMASGKQGERSQKPKQDNKVTKPQLGKMFALVGEIGMDVDEAKQTMYDRFNVKSSKELTVSQASEFIEWLEIKKREQS